MSSKPQRREAFYEFGGFRLDVSRRVLLSEGEIVPLPPKALDTLLALVESDGRVLEKDELLKQVWPDTFVEEGSLSQNVSILRKTLSGGTDGHRFIQTIPKRGYRFVAPVTVVEASAVARSSGHAVEVVTAPSRSRLGYAAAAVAVLAILGASVWIWQRIQSNPLTDRDVLVLADFANLTGDPVFDSTLRDALAFQLEQSPFLKVLSDTVMRQDLQLMRRSPQERITNDLAHDICVREAEKATLGGSIASLGKSYAIELKAANCQTGAILARAQADAGDKEHVLQAVAKASQDIRAKLGESLSSIQKLAPPESAWNVTTGSLEAFEDFRTGARLYAQGRYSEAVPELERATELDPNLAFAWTWLAVAYYNSGGARERFEEYNEKAWALRDRISAYERLWITSSRGGQTVGQYIEGFETWSRTYPRETMPVIGLGRVYQSAGDFEAALAKFQEAHRLEPPRQAINVIDLMTMYGRLDRFDEAKAVAQEMFAQGEDAPMLRRQLLAFAYAQRDQEGAAKEIAWFADKPEEYLSLADQAAEARVRGQLRKSRELLQRAAELARLRNQLDSAAGFLRPDPAGDGLLGNCETSRKTPVSQLRFEYVYNPARDTRDAMLALCATPAMIERAEDLNQHWVSAYQHNFAEVPMNRAAAQLGMGHPEKAIELLQSVAPYEHAYPIAMYIHGLACLRAHRGVEAGAEFQKIIDHPGSGWGPMYPLSYVGLARAAALAGDAARARKAYGDFFALWKDADSDIPVLIQARKEYSTLLQ